MDTTRPSENPDELLLRPDEAARLLRLGRSKLYQLLASGELESITIGRARLIPRDCVIALIERQRSKGTR